MRCPAYLATIVKNHDSEIIRSSREIGVRGEKKTTQEVKINAL